MISIDTNIFVRLLTGDDKAQAAKAEGLFKKEHICITKTVMLKTEWVLRLVYEFSAEAVAGAFTTLLAGQCHGGGCASHYENGKSGA